MRLQERIRHSLLAIAGLALAHLSVVPPGYAQQATLVRDIATSRGLDPYSPLVLSGLLATGETMFFASADVSSGTEVWASDGTAHGTRLLVDACPGPCSSDPVFLGTARGVGFWATDRHAEGVLWRSDGTEAGTFALGSDLTVRPNAAVMEDLLYFAGCTPVSGCELWRTDGTAQGTTLVADLVPGEDSSFPDRFHVVGDKLFLMTQRFGDESVLWASDGTTAGTKRLAHLGFGVLAVTGGAGRLFFLRAEGSAAQLWASDGTAGGTRQLTHFAPPGAFLTYAPPLQAHGSHVYFLADNGTAGEEIWRSDGTAAGTVQVTDLRDRAPFQGRLQLVQVQRRLLFLADDGDRPKLWSTTGPSSPAAVVAEICQGGCRYLLPEHPIVAVGDRAVFVAERQGRGLEAWSTDGTPQGTALLADTCPGACGGFVEGPFPVAGHVYFVAMELGQRFNVWRSDGTAAETRRFTHFTGEALPHGPWFAARGPHLFFTARTASGDELWLGDGTPAGTRVLTDFGDLADSSTPLELLPVGNDLYFTAEEGTSRNLWRTGGSTETTDKVWEGSAAVELTSAPGNLLFVDRGVFGERDLWSWDHAAQNATLLTGLPTELPHNPELVEFRGEVYFTAHEAGVAMLWRTDGTLAGTSKAAELPPVVLYEFMTDLTAVGPEIYFTARELTGRDVWRTDGTQAGTRKVADFEARFEDPPEFTRVGPWVYFVASDTDAAQLWKSDGTATAPVHVASDPRTPSGVRELRSFAGALYFFARSPSGRGLWRSDGTPEGTILVRDFLETRQFFEIEPNFLTVSGNLLFFVADDGVGGRELWRSDGTSAGTYLVRDVLPGPSSSRLGELSAVGGRLFFVASEGVHGRELWQSDGTEHGTRLVQDIAPGAASSNPREITAADDRLYFSADDGLAGREMWALDLTAPGGSCVPTATTLCLGGRFRVHSTWRDFLGRVGVGRAVSLAADTGAFWFFGPDNVEVILKVLDGRPLNEHHWVFYGALSSVEYALTVTDVQTGLTARYWNPAGQLASVADTTGFGPLGAFSVVARSAASGLPPRLQTGFDLAAAASGCTPSPARLCLRGGRFAVEASWKDFAGNTGVGTAVPLTADTGWFWFFGPTNVEVVLKVLDGTTLNGRHWVFYGALSSVEYTLRVTDTATGAVRTYVNPSGNLASVADTGAF